MDSEANTSNTHHLGIPSVGLYKKYIYTHTSFRNPFTWTSQKIDGSSAINQASRYERSFWGIFHPILLLLSKRIMACGSLIKQKLFSAFLKKRGEKNYLLLIVEDYCEISECLVLLICGKLLILKRRFDTFLGWTRFFCPCAPW